MTLEFNPYDPALHEDPYPVYRRLRDEFPVHHNPELRFWTLSRYDDVFEALRPHFDEDRIVELAILIGTYNMQTRVLAALQIDLEPK